MDLLEFAGCWLGGNPRNEEIFNYDKILIKSLGNYESQNGEDVKTAKINSELFSKLIVELINQWYQRW